MKDGRADPLYVALDHYEDAAQNVGTLALCAMSRYRQLTDAIGGRGDLAEAKAAFHLEASLLADAHQQWAGAAQVLNAAVADTLERNEGKVVPVKPWVLPQEFADDAPPGIGPYQHPYGERGVLDTADLAMDCE
jgi:hypothetical protein